MQYFTWEEMRRYWETHNSCRASLDLGQDYEGLDNVIHPGVPLWLNEYHAHYHKMVYQKLLNYLPPAKAGASALDVGCGTGRWCRILAQSGYQTTGIDLQPELIDLNRERYPEMQFFLTSVQEFTSDEPYDLISSVAVIQHNPFSEQETIIQKLRELVKPGGYALILENIHDQAPHVFANSIREWQNKFERVGFETTAVQRYDYNFVTRSYMALARKLLSILQVSRTQGVAKHTPPELFGHKDRREISSLRESLHSHNFTVQKLTFGVDGILEPMFIHFNFALPTVHCGFVFKAK